MSDGMLFAIGSVVFIAVFTAAIGLAYVRFGELGERRGGPAIDDAHRSPGAASLTERDSGTRSTGA